MMEEKEEKVDFSNSLKKLNVKDLEDAIGSAITMFIDEPELRFTCDIANIHYHGLGGASLALKIDCEY